MTMRRSKAISSSVAGGAVVAALVIGLLIGGLVLGPVVAPAPAVPARTITQIVATTVTQAVTIPGPTVTVTKEVPPTPLYKVKIGSIAAYFEALVPVLVALSLGYFEEERLAVDVILFPGGAEVRKAVVAGEVDFGAQGSVHVGIAQNAGVDLKAVLTTFEFSTIDLLVRKELKDKVKTLPDLKGKIIGVTRFGSLTWAMAIKYVAMAGLDPKKDVTIVEVGSDLAAIAAALKTGKIDVFTGWTIVTYTMMKEDIAYPLLNILDPQQHEKYIGSTSTMEAVITAMGKTIKEKPDLVIRVVSAIKKALIYMNTHTPEEVADVILRNRKIAELAGLPRDDLVGMLKLMREGFSKDGSLSKSGWEFGAYIELVKALPAEFKPISFEQAIEPTFAGIKS
jgi:ABC-type nitrate/sulfonate/bicarbonate transport system substrate-binding protein